VAQGISAISSTSVDLNKIQTLTTVMTSGAAPTSGTYYLNASIMAVVAQGDTLACIYAEDCGTTGAFATVGPVANQTYETLPLVGSVPVPAGTAVQVQCTGYIGASATSFYNGAITGVLINGAAGNSASVAPARHSLPPKP
jgi:hypothetical protein